MRSRKTKKIAADLNSREQHLLNAEIGDTEVLQQVRTRTCIDVGLWWWWRPLWLCVTAKEVLILAVARRCHFERVAIAACHDVRYNPASGELVISSQPALRFPRLRMPASTALEVTQLIHGIQLRAHHQSQAPTSAAPAESAS